MMPYFLIKKVTVDTFCRRLNHCFVNCRLERNGYRMIVQFDISARMMAQLNKQTSNVQWTLSVSLLMVKLPVCVPKDTWAMDLQNAKVSTVSDAFLFPKSLLTYWDSKYPYSWLNICAWWWYTLPLKMDAFLTFTHCDWRDIVPCFCLSTHLAVRLLVGLVLFHAIT